MNAIRPPEERWAHLDHRALLDMRHKLLDRIQARSLDVTNGTTQWTRFDPNIQATRSGNATSASARRAKGRVTLDDRQLREVEVLLWEKHGDTEEQLTDWYAQYCERLEREALETEEAGNAAFDPAMFDSEAIAEAADENPVRVKMPEPTAKVRKQATPPAKRDRLAWVSVMQSLAAQYAAQKAGAK